MRMNSLAEDGRTERYVPGSLMHGATITSYEFPNSGLCIYEGINSCVFKPLLGSSYLLRNRNCLVMYQSMIL